MNFGLGSDLWGLSTGFVGFAKRTPLLSKPSTLSEAILKSFSEFLAWFTSKKMHFVRHKEIVKVLSYFLIDRYINGLHHSHSIKSYTSNQLFWSRNMHQMFTRTIVFSIKKIQKNLLPYLQSWTKFMKQCQEIKRNWAGQENFEICFCVIFDN